MSSISNSNILAKTTDLSLSFKLDHYRTDTVRDIFVNAVKSPIRALLGSQDRLEALKKVNFEIKRGERVAVIGKNGAGKTTFCRCIAGMYVPDSGHVYADEDCRSIFDSVVGILPDLTGRENAKLLCKFMYPSLSKQEVNELVDEALDFSELNKFVDTPFKFYSKGMQTRLTLSIISARPCELLILDEIFDGADQFFREKVSARVLKMIEKSGAVIFVSHSTENVKQACNRVVVFNHGEIVFDGDVDQGIEYYNSLGG